MVNIRTDATLAKRVHSEERNYGGGRANFHVYHRTIKGNKPRFDISYEDTAEEAAAEMVKDYRGKITVEFVVPCDKTVAL